MRAVLKNILKKDQKEISGLLKEAIKSIDEIQKLADRLNERDHKNAANTLERFLPGTMNYKGFPKSHWKRIRTMNVMEESTRN